MKTVLLTTFSHITKAHLYRTKLESEGIPCFLVNENFTNLLPHLYNLLGSGAQIRVLEEDLTRAREISAISDKVICPNCHSENVKLLTHKSKRHLIFLLISIFSVRLFGNLLNQYTCEECGISFSRD